MITVAKFNEVMFRELQARKLDHTKAEIMISAYERVVRVYSENGVFQFEIDGEGKVLDSQ